MNRRYLQFTLSFTKAIVFVLSVCLLFPLTVLAHSQMPQSYLSACMQAPANLDPTTLTEAQLRLYGLPLRPTDSQVQTRWLKEANRIKLDHHICNPQLVTGSNAHHSTHPKVSAIRAAIPFVTQHQTDAFAGNYAIGSQGSYSFSSTNYNLHA